MSQNHRARKRNMRAWREDELFRRSRRSDARADARIDDNGADVIAARQLHTDHNDKHHQPCPSNEHAGWRDMRKSPAIDPPPDSSLRRSDSATALRDVIERQIARPLRAEDFSRASTVVARAMPGYADSFRSFCRKISSNCRA
ncbi:hypothetical protein ACVMFA_008758 [Bradyrhizobium liaoningense]|uniref:hypothetical protein n=1 Tax=Bradyrhizobium TaxID=374 RepID=UPI0012BC3AAC|nr:MULTISPECIES: hypothetical protein [Bradyrhizobium]